MTTMLNSLGNGIGDWLLFASIALAGLTLLGWGVCRIFRSRSPALRYLVWSAVLVASMILPSLWLHGPELHLPVLAAPPVSASSIEGFSPQLPGAAAVEPVVTVVSMDVPADVPPAPSVAAFPVKRALVMAWFVGVAVFLTRLMVAGYRLKRLCRRASVANPEQCALVQEVGHVRILVSEEIEGPVCCGWWRPTVVLPRELWEERSPEELRMVFGHELAHVSRGDYVGNLLQRLVEAVLFFHPCVWYASAQLSHERERICDNHVLAMGAKATDYVQMLSGLLERGWCGAEPQSVALFEGKLLPRVRSLLDGRSSTGVRLSRRLTFVLVGLIAVVMAGVGIVRLEVRADPVPTAEVDPDQVATELKAIGGKLKVYRDRNGSCPEQLKAVLKDGSVADPYNPQGGAYAYEAVHRYAMVSSCGPDGIPGNDDDLVCFVAGRDEHSGSRAEIMQAGLLSGDPDGQHEYTNRHEIPRPVGNCSISGRVVSKATGDPVRHACVYLFYIETHAPLFINVAWDGSFIFKDIPAGHTFPT